MTAAIDIRNEVTDRDVLRSPGLGQFRKTPFRLLRLPSNATAKQAIWQSDKALARARVGMQLPDPDPVSWLPPGDEIEIQEAARTMESPLARLVEQLLWFDLEGDPSGGLLLSGLTGVDGARLRQYLDLPTDGASMAHRINQLNLRLLLGFSALRDVGPAIAARPVGNGSPIELSWQNKNGMQVADDAHRAARARAKVTGTADLWATLLGQGVTAWGELLASTPFVDHVRAKIAALGDELLTADDTEAVIAGLRTRIADLVVGETKLEMGQGRIANVAFLSSIAGKSKIDAETWLVAFRPLKTQFQSELADLAPDAETGLGIIEDVAAYLDRLKSLAARWRPLDDAQLLGLSELVDDAAQEAFSRLRMVPREQAFEPRFKQVLAQVALVAHSPSVKERVKGYEARLADMAKAMCHYCGKRELDPEYCASVSSRREISRERWGNTIRVQYQVGARPIARCQHCATLHGFIRSTGSIGFYTLATSVLLLAIVHPDTWFAGAGGGGGFVLVCMGIAAAFGAGFIVRAIAATRVTPAGERRMGEYMGSSAVEGLRGDGFFTFRYDSRPDAWTLVNKQGAKHRHAGGNVGVALKTLLYAALVIGFIALRVCAGSHY
jgi:hypothetical protein